MDRFFTSSEPEGAESQQGCQTRKQLDEVTLFCFNKLNFQLLQQISAATSGF